MTNSYLSSQHVLENNPYFQQQFLKSFDLISCFYIMSNYRILLTLASFYDKEIILTVFYTKNNHLFKFSTLEEK